MELEIAIHESKTVGNITITNHGGGHKILRGENDEWRGGDLPFSDIELTSEWIDTRSVTVYHTIPWEDNIENDIYYGQYHIKVINVGWNGESVKLTLENLKNSEASEQRDMSQIESETIILKQNEPYTYKNLLITHNGGVQKIAFDGSDPCNVSLTLKQINTGIEKSYTSLYENSTNSPNVDIQFEWYIIRIQKITTWPFDVTMIIKNI